MRSLRHRLGLGGALLLVSCSGADITAPPNPPPGDVARLRVTALVVGTPIDLIVARVTAADIVVPLVFNLPVADGVATGTLKIPPGAGRTITLEAFDDAGDITHEGSATVDVRAGPNAPVSIAMVPRGGEVPVTATLANVSIIVSPSSSSIAVGGTQQFSAEILGPDDQPVSGTVTWAVTNPAFARADANGLVTGMHAGALQVVATYGGVAGLAQLAVTQGPTGTIQGTVSSTAFGPLAGVSVVVGARSTVTDGAGSYLLTAVPTGAVNVVLGNLPAGCPATSSPADVTEGGTTVLDFDVECTLGGELIFNEIMANPSAVADEVGEWLELYNSTTGSIDLTGWIVRTQSGNECTLSGTVAAGGYIVAARSTDAAVNGGIPGAVLCAVPLTNTALTLSLITPGGTTADVAVFATSVAGASQSLDPDARTAAGNDSSGSWCLATAPYGAGDLGTPGAGNPDCL